MVHMKAKKQIHIRLDERAQAAADQLRRNAYPTPSYSEVISQALVEKAEREAAKQRRTRD